MWFTYSIQNKHVIEEKCLLKRLRDAQNLCSRERETFLCTLLHYSFCIFCSHLRLNKTKQNELKNTPLGITV